MANLPKGEFNMPPGVSTRDIPGNEPKKKSNLCRWAYDDIYDNYETACGRAFTLIDGTLAKNKMRYCCYCGKRIEEKGKR